MERERINHLPSEAQSWEQGQLIRRSLGAYEERLKALNIQLNEEQAKKLKWAYDQADRLDPLMPNPRSVLDEKP